MLTGTGEQNVVTMQEILDNLGQYGISAERKSIYDDMEALRDFGYDIQYKRGRTGGYYLKQEKEDSTAAAGSSDESGCAVQEDVTAAAEQSKPQKSSGACTVKMDEVSESGKTMKLLCKKEREQEVREYFGDLGEYRQKSSGFLMAVVPQISGPYFFGWLTAMGQDVHIVKPKKTAAAYRDYLKILAKNYKGR